MSGYLLRSVRILVTIDQNNEIRYGADVLVADGTIAAIGDGLAVPDGVEVIDCSRRLLLPGLVNLHTHTPMTLLRGVAEGVDLAGFLRRVWTAEAAVMHPGTVETGARLAALESLRAGVTTALDMYLFPQAAHAGAVAAGLRHVAGPVFFDSSGPDGLSWPERIAGAGQWQRTLAETGGPHVPTALMPHATYTNSPVHLREIAELATDFDLVHIHASETAAENADVLARHGATPVQLLASSGLLAGRVVLGHGIHLDEADLALVSRSEATVAHCPGSNLKLASGALHWERLRGRGIRLGLGSDGCSSSNDLDLWQVMRQAALLARLAAQDPTAGDATDVLRAATIDGAGALGMGDLIGSIEVGKRADLVLLDLDAPHLTPVHDVPALLVFSAGRGDVTDVFVDGERVIADRVSTRLDTDALLAEARAIGASVDEALRSAT